MSGKDDKSRPGPGIVRPQQGKLVNEWRTGKEAEDALRSAGYTQQYTWNRAIPVRWSKSSQPDLAIVTDDRQSFFIVKYPSDVEVFALINQGKKP